MFGLQLQKCGKINLEKKRKRKEEVKQEVIGSIIEGERSKTNDLDEKAGTVKKCKDAVSIVRANKDTINLY